MIDTLAFGCLHAPYQHADALDFLADVRRAYKPERIVNLGDEVDAYAFSRYVRSPSMASATTELTEARKVVKELGKLFPKVYCCKSNHTLRVFKRAEEAGLPEDVLRTVSEILNAPRGWVWKDRWLFDGAVFFHGDGYSGKDGAMKAADAFRRSVVMAHIHSQGYVRHRAGVYDRIFGLQTGCLIDAESLAFAYNRAAADRPVLGCGVIKDGTPLHVPFVP